MSIPPSIAPQFTPENIREMERARIAMKKIRRAVSTAMFEGYTVAICGGLTAIFSIGSIPDMVSGMILTAIGIIEVMSATRLRRLDLVGARNLVINQYVFAGIILFYALWNLGSEMIHPSKELPGVSASDAQLLGGGFGDMMHSMMMLFYGTLIIAAVVEGAMAAYYQRRAESLRQYIAATPAWITEMQKTGVSL